MIRHLAIRIALACKLGIAAFSSASMPMQEESPTPGLEAAVDIQLDGNAVPTITAKSYLDALVGQGWMQGQERFFQMDLMVNSQITTTRPWRAVA